MRGGSKKISPYLGKERDTCFANCIMNSTESVNDSCYVSETSVELNNRYAAALLPLTVIFGFLLAVGIMGNLMTLVVFSLNRDYKRTTFKVYVIAFALIDLSTCVTLFPTEIMTHRYYFLFQSTNLCKAKCFVTVFGASASCFALLVISIDRYRKVMRPLRRQLTPSVTIIILVLIILIFPILLAIPATVMCGIHHTSKKNVFGGDTEIFLCETEERFKNSRWRTIYKLTLIVLQLLVSVIYVVLYAFVMKEALKHIRAIKTRESISLVVAQTKSSLETDSVDNIDGTTVASNEDEQKVMNKKSTCKGSFSSEREHGASRGVVVQNDISENFPKRANVKKSKSLISKRSQISISSLKTEFPTKTLVWFVLTIIFIITNLTHLGLSMKRQDIVNMSTTELFWFLFFFRVYFINHVINPVVYTVFLKSFRSHCRKIFHTIKDRMNL